ncbi:MAG: yabQ [Oscillospiraceae bacterium]|jgi:spore cortex biosynthesis protein YabQ|nr:yabQ [Oscillospiraceae bacterium]
MEVSISEQSLIFLYSCVLGIGLGIVYDIFRIIRLAIKTGPIIIFIQDTIYFMVAAFSTFTFLLFFTDGQIRVYVLIGEFLGWILYYFTMGKLVINASKFIIKIIKIIFKWIYKIFIRPFVIIFSYIYHKICELFVNISRIFKKVSQKRKFLLKKKAVLLYNLNNKRREKKKGEKINAQKKSKKK